VRTYPPDPLTQTTRLNHREWKKELRKQQRHIERDITKMQRELDKQKKEIKHVAAKDPVAAKMLAKSYVQMTKTHAKLYMAKVIYIYISLAKTPTLLP